MNSQIPFRERLACSINDAKQVSNLGHTKINELIKSGVLETTKVAGRRLVKVPSLVKLIEG